MEILGHESGGRGTRAARRASLALAVLMAASIAGCMLFGPEDQQPRFSHAKHAEESVGCDDCHVPRDDGGPPSMPRKAQCDLCHAGMDDEKPPEERAAALFVDGELRAAHVTALMPDVIFSHAGHVDMGLECGTCHQGIESSEAVDESLAFTMARCQACHAGAGVDPGCATCHQEIRTDRPPPNHDHAWKKIHGPLAREGSATAANDCAMCHTEASCAACHADEKPSSHNNLWRLKTHGTVAGMDRMSCATCHRSDFCNRCHAETTPQNHTAMWGSPQDKHCLQCHFPLKSESCSVCHKSTPSHLEAPPKPDVPPHSPGMNCVQCHGVSAPLPHPNKGDDCNACHK